MRALSLGILTRRNHRRLLAALYGPTSSGKTAMAVQIAQRVERELGRTVVVISADSRQVYRYMDIGTSKTTKAEMHGIRHEMLDVVEPVRKFELEDYTRLARRPISDAFAANVVPFIVGGTGIYVTALLGDWETDRVGAARRSLRRDFPRSMTDDAYAMLRRLNRGKAGQVHRNNYEAIINALAIIVSQGDSGSSDHLDLTTAIFGLDPGPQAVDQRVAQTYGRQVQSGLFEEIKSLNARYDLDREIRLRGRDSQNQVLHTHGYREYFDVALAAGKPVSGLTGSELAEVRARVVERIRRHTRRQRTWFSKLPGTRLVTSADQAFARVSRLLDTGR